ncbi:MAG: hypothetical protein ABSC55_24230 [Syntrophorhabdales bacterium]|jgi:hypothetical protein
MNDTDFKRLENKVDKLLHALGLDESRSSADIQREVRHVLELRRSKEILKKSKKGVE